MVGTRKLSQLALWVAAVVMFGLSFGFGFSGSGSGTAEDPYQITSCAQWQEMAPVWNHYLLMNDIDCTSDGNDIRSNLDTLTVDGGGHTITVAIDIVDDSSSSAYWWLFNFGMESTLSNIIISGSMHCDDCTYFGWVFWSTFELIITWVVVTADVSWPGLVWWLVAFQDWPTVISHSHFRWNITGEDVWWIIWWWWSLSFVSVEGNLYGSESAWWLINNWWFVDSSYFSGSIVAWFSAAGINASSNWTHTISNSYVRWSISSEWEDAAWFSLSNATIVNSYMLANVYSSYAFSEPDPWSFFGFGLCVESSFWLLWSVGQFYDTVCGTNTRGISLAEFQDPDTFLLEWRDVVATGDAGFDVYPYLDWQSPTWISWAIWVMNAEEWCMDPNAINYLPGVSTDDGSCLYPMLGSGTEEDPYEIFNCYHWTLINNDLHAYYHLMNDLDCTAIGNNVMIWWKTQVAWFQWYMNGNGYTITVDIDMADDLVGVFRTVQAATIHNIHSSWSVVWHSNVWWLIARATGWTTITSSSSYAIVSSAWSAFQSNNIWWLVWSLLSDSSIFNSSAYGSVFAAEMDAVWWLVWWAYDNVVLSWVFAVGDVIGNIWVWWLIWFSEDDLSVTNCYALGNVSGNDMVWWLIWYNETSAIIENCYSAGIVDADDNFWGIFGLNNWWLSLTILNVFWDLLDGNNPIDDWFEGSSAQTSENMKDFYTYLNAWWDIAPTSLVYNNGYPFLWWEQNMQDHTWYINAHFIGCTDSAAMNYNQRAIEDDDSCTYQADSVWGGWWAGWIMLLDPINTSPAPTLPRFQINIIEKKTPQYWCGTTEHLAAGHNFGDVSGTRYNDAVDVLVQHCLIHGYNNEGREFGVNNPLQAGEMYKVFALLSMASVDTSTPGMGWSYGYKTAGDAIGLWSSINTDRAEYTPVTQTELLQVTFNYMKYIGLIDEVPTFPASNRGITRGEFARFVNIVLGLVSTK